MSNPEDNKHAIPMSDSSKLESFIDVETLYHDMIELLPDTIIAVDMQGTVLLCNEALIKLTGYQREEMIGKNFVEIELLDKAMMPEYVNLLGAILNGEYRPPVEAPINCKDGRTVLLEVRFSRLRIGADNIVQATGRDITDRKRMETELSEKNEQLDAQNEELVAANEELRATEEELRAANEELLATNQELHETQERLLRSEKLAVIGQLAGGVGHELRNPLGAIKSVAYYVRSKINKADLAYQEPKILEFLDIMDDEINTADKIIGDLLGFSRVGKPSVSPVNIDTVINKALAHSTIPKNVILRRNLDSHLPEIKIDVEQINQVMVNVITNAVQAMPDGGELNISTAPGVNALVIEVSDSGCGIPPNNLDRIFDPLFTTKAKGIGLGLAVCRSIIERHQGRIDVESQERKGTTFSIELPTKADDK